MREESCGALCLHDECQRRPDSATHDAERSPAHVCPSARSYWSQTLEQYKVNNAARCPTSARLPLSIQLPLTRMFRYSTLLATAVLVGKATAWGDLGHETIGYVAMEVSQA